MDIEDENLWLEDVEGEAALDWVRARNAESEAELFGRDDFTRIRTDILEVLEAEDRIAYPSLHGDTVHNFWTDARNPRGLLRRTTWDDYAGGDPTWETILDIDALGAAEGESWVFHGSQTRRPDRRRALIDLSPGGSDASVTREFDLVEKRFVAEAEGGFVRPLAKGGLTWIDDDTVYVTTDFGEGSLTRSGYPRTVRRWRRGTPIDDAEIVFEGTIDDISVQVQVSTLPGFEHHLIRQALDFYTARFHLLRDDELRLIDVPTHIEVSVHEQWLTFELREAWAVGDTTHPGGSLLAVPIEHFLAGSASPTPVFVPTPTRALGFATWTRNHLVLNVMEDVRSKVEIATPADDGTWSLHPLLDAPSVWSVGASQVDADASDDLWIDGNDFVTPETLYRASVSGGARVIRREPHRFDADGIAITQHFATSADGTRIPYFEVGRTDRDRPTRTLLDAYGGFEVPNVPAYAGGLGRAWLADGGTYVLANIRGGGEYGPAWHRAGLRDQRHRVYEDHEAVARDLIDRGVATPAHLGITGGSNGGLLVGNMYVRTPELFGAVVCQVPLLDMARYHLLLAGASWMAEYGDPDDPDDWAYLQTYSPYHLADPDATYPPILFTTSTRDDRVHPGHARKMAARLLEQGHDVTYWENIEGGHGGAADAGQRATMQALRFAFLRDRLAD